jgi:hypothetical protein
LRICVIVKTGIGHRKDAEFGIHPDNPWKFSAPHHMIAVVDSES